MRVRALMLTGGAGTPHTWWMVVADRAQHPPTSGIRRDRPEHRSLIGKRRDVADALPAIGQHHRHINQYPPRIVHGLRHGPSGEHADNCAVNVVRSARSATSRAPTCDTTPMPSVDTTTPRRIRVACTWKVPSRSEIQGSRQAQNPPQDRHVAHLHADRPTRS